MSKKINEDIKKWQREIWKLITSKNVENYECIFAVPNNNRMHKGILASSEMGLNIGSNLFVQGLSEYLIDQYDVVRMPKTTLSYEIDDLLYQLKHEVVQRIEIHIKRREPEISGSNGGKK